MKRELIKIVKCDDDVEVTAAGTAPELIAAITSLITKIAKSLGVPVEVLCFAMMNATRKIEKNYDESTDTDKSIDDLFNDIIGRSDI